MLQNIWPPFTNQLGIRWNAFQYFLALPSRKGFPPDTFETIWLFHDADWTQKYSLLQCTANRSGTSAMGWQVTSRLPDKITFHRKPNLLHTFLTNLTTTIEYARASWLTWNSSHPVLYTFYPFPFFQPSVWRRYWIFQRHNMWIILINTIT